MFGELLRNIRALGPDETQGDFPHNVIGKRWYPEDNPIPEKRASLEDLKQRVELTLSTLEPKSDDAKKLRVFLDRVDKRLQNV